MHKKETDTIHVSQCVTMLKNSRFARLIAAPNFLNSDFLAEAKKKGLKIVALSKKKNNLFVTSKNETTLFTNL